MARIGAFVFDLRCHTFGTATGRRSHAALRLKVEPENGVSESVDPPHDSWIRPF